MKRTGSVQRKILLLMLGGLALAASRSNRQQIHVIKGICEGLREIDRQAIDRAVGSMCASKLISEKYNRDGTITLTLSEYGKKRATTFNLEKIKLEKPKTWDGKWRIVIFDIPHKYRKSRDSFRLLLNRMDFYPLQKSVYIHPFDCRREIEFITKFNRVTRFVRMIIADSVDNESYLRKHFNL